MQNAIAKYGLNKFSFGILEFFMYDNKPVTHKLLTDLETYYIQKYCFNNLYNFMQTATSLLGYKHTDEAKLKIYKFFENVNNHPMYGKTHTEEARALISKPGVLNPMYGKKHNIATKQVISDKLSKYTNGVGIYDLNYNLLSSFRNNSDMAKDLAISKVTAGKNLKGGLVRDELYRFKINK